MNTEQEIAMHNATVVNWLVDCLNESVDYQAVFVEYNNRQHQIFGALNEFPDVVVVKTEDLREEMERIFEHYQLDVPIRRVVVICALLLVTVKYTLLTDQKIKEFQQAKRTLPKQKKFFEILAKYRREQRNSFKVKDKHKLAEIFSAIPLRILKHANRFLGKNVKGDSYNLALLARLLFELTKSNAAKTSSDNELLISLYPVFRCLYPEISLLDSEEAWMIAPAEIATSNDFRDYQIKSMKSIIYYSKKDMFNGGAGGRDFDQVSHLLNQALTHLN